MQVNPWNTRTKHSINQSINQSNDHHSRHQSINQSINRSITIHAINRAINQSTEESIKSINVKLNQSINWSIDRKLKRPAPYKAKKKWWMKILKKNAWKVVENGLKWRMWHWDFVSTWPGFSLVPRTVLEVTHSIHLVHRAGPQLLLQDVPRHLQVL